eukprot:Filipodium_phascolosomae@DN4084_c0_g1_i1.p1
MLYSKTQSGRPIPGGDVYNHGTIILPKSLRQRHDLYTRALYVCSAEWCARKVTEYIPWRVDINNASEYDGDVHIYNRLYHLRPLRLKGANTTPIRSSPREYQNWLGCTSC